MKFDELFEKYMNDNEFKDELLLEIKEEGLNNVIVKYDLPYSVDELKEMISNKIEAANCDGDTVAYSILSVGVGCLVSAIKDGKMTEDCIL